MTNRAGRTRCGAILSQVSRSASAVDQSSRSHRGGAAEIPLLEQDDPEAAPGGITCNADAVQTTADDRKIEIRHPPAIARRCEPCPHLIGRSGRTHRKTC